MKDTERKADKIGSSNQEWMHYALLVVCSSYQALGVTCASTEMSFFMYGFLMIVFKLFVMYTLIFFTFHCLQIVKDYLFFF